MSSKMSLLSTMSFAYSFREAANRVKSNLLSVKEVSEIDQDNILISKYKINAHLIIYAIEWTQFYKMYYL